MAMMGTSVEKAFQDWPLCCSDCSNCWPIAGQWQACVETLKNEATPVGAPELNVVGYARATFLLKLVSWHQSS